MIFYGIVISIINAIIANKKGYSPVLWFFACSPLAFVILLLKSNSNLEEDLSEREKKIKTANREAVWLIVLGVLATLMILAYGHGISQN